MIIIMIECAGCYVHTRRGAVQITDEIGTPNPN